MPRHRQAPSVPIMEWGTVQLDGINPAPYNPRKDLQAGDEEYEAIKRSIQEFGYVDPLVVNRVNNILVGGHQRLKVLRELGVVEAPVAFVNITDPIREKALNVALNSDAIRGVWDIDKLDEIMQELAREAPDLVDFLREEELVDELLGVDREAEGPATHPAMELQPFEHWDYLVFMFKDSRDFVAACERFGIQRVDSSAVPGRKKIGLGRVLDGRRLLTPHSSSEP